MPPAVQPADVERWLAADALVPIERIDRDGITAWDLVLDGRRRFDLPVTVILDPDHALIALAHFAPPIGDMYRKSYRKLLRWNDEFPFAKFSVGEDERPLLAVEIAVGQADAAALGLALARIVGLADLLLEESAGWLWIGGKIPDRSARTPRNADFLERHAGRLRELFGG